MVRATRTGPSVSLLLAAAALAAGCTPEIPDTSALVAAPLLLAASATPAENRPGAPVVLRVLAVAPDGPAPRPLDWAWCTSRPPLTSPGSLSPGCLAPDGADLLPLGAAEEISTTMPAGVCQTFGPDQPAPPPGQPAGRPADPDPTGGYYQPLRIFDAAAAGGRATASFEARALCHLAGATPVQQAELDRRYRLNENPIVASLALADGTPLPSLENDSAAVTPVAAGTALQLRVAWSGCPNPGEDACGDGVCGIDETADACPADCAAPRGCGGAEVYLWFDPATRAFSARRESIVVSWFATGGAFTTSRTGRSEAEAALASDSDNVWTAPAAPADVWIWVVLRDARGGAGWSSHRLRIE